MLDDLLPGYKTVASSGSNSGRFPTRRETVHCPTRDVRDRTALARTPGWSPMYSVISPSRTWKDPGERGDNEPKTVGPGLTMPAPAAPRSTLIPRASGWAGGRHPSSRRYIRGRVQMPRGQVSSARFSRASRVGSEAPSGVPRGRWAAARGHPECSVCLRWQARRWRCRSRQHAQACGRARCRQLGRQAAARSRPAQQHTERDVAKNGGRGGCVNRQ